MAELLDRDFQRSFLDGLAACYPDGKNVEQDLAGDSHVFKVNLHYLEEHGLVSVVRSGHSRFGPIRAASITAKGLDFIADDGGLGAILGVLTVRVHEDTLKRIIIDRIASSNDDQTVKERTIAAVKELPAEAVKGLATKALEAGLSAIPNLAVWVGSALASS